MTRRFNDATRPTASADFTISAEAASGTQLREYRVSEIKTDRKLPIPRIVHYSEDFSKVVGRGWSSRCRRSRNARPATATAIDVVIVAVEEIVELDTEREPVLAFGAHCHIL